MIISTLIVARIFAICVLCCYSMKAGPIITTETKAILYLQKYGYLNETNSNSSSAMDQVQLSHAINDFQRFTGLAETGILDIPTLKMMSMPVYGVRSEVEQNGSARRRKRYVLSGSSWNKKNLAYKITKYPTSIKDKDKVDKEIARAFKIWSDVSGLNFVNMNSEVSKASIRHDPVDIEIRFEKDEHGDNKFKGASFLAFNPQKGGDVHFNDELKWTIDQNFGKNLFQIAAHAFGHSLGLQHSKVKTAMMFPIYRGYKHTFILDKDDILGIQALYGPPTKTDTKPKSKPSENPDVSDAPDICQHSSIDAATMTQDGRTYVFKRNYYWEVEETGIKEGYPRKISDDWSLYGNLDAALTSTSGETFFFKEDKYWRFYNKVKKSGPHNISLGFRDIPSDIDTAFAWNESIYFFKGDVYWKYVGNNAPPVSSSYPQPISNWKGLPNNIDAAFQWKNQNTYFFKGSQYYRMKKTTQSVEDGHPPYPRLTSVWWFGCNNTDESNQIIPPNLCQDSSIDAATTIEDGQIYVFKGLHYWGVGENGITDGYPREISADWPGLPGNLDAAMTLTNGKTYFFKKNEYWRFHNKKMDGGYPKNISVGIPGIPNDVDAAVVWSLNEKIYFFKGDKYWRLDLEGPPYVSSRYPQPICNWEGLPNYIDAALRWRNNTYFFKGNQYYKLNEWMPSVMKADPPYPRSTYFWWFDCENWKPKKKSEIEVESQSV